VNQFRQDFIEAYKIFRYEKLEFGNERHIRARNILRKVTRAQQEYSSLLELRRSFLNLKGYVSYSL